MKRVTKGNYQVLKSLYFGPFQSVIPRITVVPDTIFQEHLCFFHSTDPQGHPRGRFDMTTAISFT